MKPLYSILLQLLLLCLVVGLVYSPAFHAEPCLLDDVALLNWLQGDSQIELKSLLSPGSSIFMYYRPVILFSYWLSKTLWHATAQAMHTENVIFHLLNVMLLFWLIRTSLKDNEKSDRYLPLLGALLFAVHPVTTESVNWIAGRSDLLAGGFLISSTAAIVAWRSKRSRWWLLLLALLLLAGAIMAKEIAWGFLIVLPFFLANPYDSKTYTLEDFFGNFSRLEKLLFISGIALCFFLAAVFRSFLPVIVLSAILGLVVMYRKPRKQQLPRYAYLVVSGLLLIVAALVPYCVQLAHESASGNYVSKYSRTILLISFEFDNSIARFSAALAFYIKKLLLPLPLSFAITDIATGYLFAGIAVIILTAFLFAWRSQAALLFLAGIVLILPALPLLHGQIAWTPYAERYIYISSGFWIASLTVGISSLKRSYLRASFTVICLLLIPVGTLITYKRSLVWQTNVALFADTAKKSPNHPDSRMLYMSALSKADRLPEAMEQYRRIQADVPKMRMRYINELAERLNKGGFKREAWEVVDSTLAKPLPGELEHPLKNDDWQQLYKLHEKLRLELFPQMESRVDLNS